MGHTANNFKTNDFLSEDQKSELLFRETEPGDTILIYTSNSRYAFSLIDPAKGQGMLSGGLFADKRVVAFLTGAFDEVRDGVSLDEDCIKTGARILFYFEAGDETKSLILSKVVRVALVRDPGEKRL